MYLSVDRPNNEQLAICTDDYSDISPLTGGNVAFSTLEGRPGGYKFETSMVLHVSGESARIWIANVDDTMKSGYFRQG
jgi:hypothetical protein